MIKLSVCIEMFWTKLPVEERIRRVKAAGYSAFEFWGSSNKDLDAIRAAQAETGLACAGIVCEPGNALVERGNDAEMIAGARRSIAVAQSLGCTRLIVTTGNVLADESYEITRRRGVRKLRQMAALADDAGVTLCLEPLNPLVDHKGYWLTTMAQAADIVEEVASPALTILYDIYHQQITEGNVIANLRTYANLIGHIHVAGVPGRHELVGGELDYRAILSAISEVDYTGYVGLEFRPAGDEETALAEAHSLLYLA
ncbi:MAG: TIM barrel protein [Caldilineaceae bacterium]|nr:TIM barrel protein [Caldilineaceae bacterium]